MYKYVKSAAVCLSNKRLMKYKLPAQHVSVKMAAPAVDQCAPVHLGTREHCVRLHVPPAVQPVITLITATVVSVFETFATSNMRIHVIPNFPISLVMSLFFSLLQSHVL